MQEKSDPGPVFYDFLLQNQPFSYLGCFVPADEIGRLRFSFVRRLFRDIQAARTNIGAFFDLKKDGTAFERSHGMPGLRWYFSGKYRPFAEITYRSITLAESSKNKSTAEPLSIIKTSQVSGSACR